MRTAALLLIMAVVCPGVAHSLSFKETQMQFPRVRAAYLEKEGVVHKLFDDRKAAFPPRQIFIRIFKKEQALEVWSPAITGDSLVLIATYPVCSSSGELGPKRRRGDGQVPEGFYHIMHFNPTSNFYLSLGVSYPNRSDLYFAGKHDPGGAIYIHGNCVTIGCVPITDDRIKELYLACLEARAGGQAAIPVHIFPCRMDGDGMKYLGLHHGGDKGMTAFWENMREGFAAFEKNHFPPKVTIDSKGKYFFGR
jgi:murein L,D-transpeptidase YafK